jgi:hypothetical protein
VVTDLVLFALSPSQLALRGPLQQLEWAGGEAGEDEQRGGCLAEEGGEERKGVYTGVPVGFFYSFFFFQCIILPRQAGLEQGLEATR